MELPKLSYSKWSKFKSCPRQYQLWYEEGLRPRVRDVKLEEGRIFHESMQLYYTGRAAEIQGYLDRESLRYEDLCRRQMARGFMDVGSMNRIIGKLEAMRHVLRLYVRNAPRLDEDFEVLKPAGENVERRWEVKAAGVVLNGVMDALGTSKRYGGLTIMEHKYVAGFDEELMELDQQITMYTLAVFLETGRIPTVTYNVVRKPGQRIGAEESVQDFSGRVSKVLDSMESGGLIIRREYARTKRHLDLLLEEIEGTVPLIFGKHYRYRNKGQHCAMFCPFTKVCLFRDPGVVSTFYTVEEGSGRAAPVSDAAVETDEEVRI